MSKIVRIIGIAIGLSSIIIFISFTNFHQEIQDRDREVLESRIGVTLPSNISNLNFEKSQSSYNHWTAFSFSAPPDEVESFLNRFNICENILYPYYDAFNAEIGISEIRRNVLVSSPGGNFMYISYSNDIPETVLGNRCYEHIITVDKSNLDLYDVKYGIPLSSNASSIEFPLMSEALGNNISPLESGLPFMVIGMKNIGGKYWLVSRNICFETMIHYTFATTPDSKAFDHLTKSNIIVYINGVEVFLGVIDDKWTLTSVANEAVQEERRFSNCVWQEWVSGTNNMRISFENIEDELLYEGSFTFYVDYNKKF